MLSIQIKHDVSADAPLCTAIWQGGCIRTKQPEFSFRLRHFISAFPCYGKCKYQAIFILETYPLNHSLNYGWVACASRHGHTQRRHQVSTVCLDSLTLTCELWAVPTSCLYFVRNLCWCAYDVISPGFFLRGAAVKHLMATTGPGRELVTLYSEKQT